MQQDEGGQWMIQIMPLDEARKRQLHNEYLERLFPMPKNIWRPELTEEQQKEHQRMLDAGEIEF